MQQPTSGMSQPSVSTMQFVTSSISPDASRASVASRSGFGRRAVDVFGAHAGSHEFIADVERVPDVDGEATVFRRSPNLCQCVTMSPTSLRPVHALGELRFDVVAAPGCGRRCRSGSTGA